MLSSRRWSSARPSSLCSHTHKHAALVVYVCCTAKHHLSTQWHTQAHSCFTVVCNTHSTLGLGSLPAAAPGCLSALLDYTSALLAVPGHHEEAKAAIEAVCGIVAAVGERYRQQRDLLSLVLLYESTQAGAHACACVCGWVWGSTTLVPATVPATATVVKQCVREATSSKQLQPVGRC
jgi:hypothetical protein